MISAEGQTVCNLSIVDKVPQEPEEGRVPPPCVPFLRGGSCDLGSGGGFGMGRFSLGILKSVKGLE